MLEKDTLQHPRKPRDSANKITIRPHFFFDKASHTLIGRNGHAIKLRSQSLNVFLFLLTNANEVVSKNEILSAVWNGLEVTDDSITQCIGDIRRVLGKQHRSLLQTVPKKGYRLSLGSDDTNSPIIAPLGYQQASVHEAEMTDEPQSKASSTYTSEAIPAVIANNTNFILGVAILVVASLFFFYSAVFKQQSGANSVGRKGPILAILPFKNVGTPTGTDFFSDGITEDITFQLSRFSDLGIVSWRAVSNLMEAETSHEKIAKKFDVRYLISGTVQHDNERVRVAVRLTDAQDGRLLWSERYNEQLEDVFHVQDHIAKQIVTTLSVKVTKIETQFVQSVPTENIAAYQLTLLGRKENLKRTKSGNINAVARFQEAIDLDPDYSDAYVYLGEAYLEQAVFGWTEWPDKQIQSAEKLGLTAIRLNGGSARAVGLLARVQIRIGEIDKAQQYLDRAFAFNQNDPALHEIQGLIHLWSGKSELAIEHLEYVLHYDPGSLVAASHLGVAYYINDRPSDSIKTIERISETAPKALFKDIILTASLVEVDELDLAKAAATFMQRQHPFLTADGVAKMEIFSNRAVKKRLMSSLRLAGIK